jgi:Xaa-Pro aminopeptidase
MLTAEGCVARRRRLWKALPGPCDLLIVADPAHLVYFADYVQSPFTFRAVDAAALLVLSPAGATLVADNLDRPFAEKAHVEEVFAPVWYEGKRSAPHRQGMLVRSALEVAGKVPGRRVGVEFGTVPAGVVEGLRAARPGLELVDLDPVVRPLKRAKDPDELAAIRRAIRAAEAGQAAALAGVAPGMTEFQAYRLVEQASLAAAGERAIVYGDFVSGPRAADRLGPPTHRVLERGDLFILDFSAVLDGYRGDFANTIAVGGAPSARQLELYEACVAAMRAGESRLAPGTPARAVYDAVRDAFAARGLADHFRGHAGHGVGLGHPEPPYFVPDSTDTIRLGDVVTLEPGLYGDDFGGMRFEHNYLITPGGFETLTQHQIALSRESPRPDSAPDSTPSRAKGRE